MKKISTLLLLINAHICCSQFSEQKPIDNNAQGINEILTADLNNDQFTDIILAQKFIFDSKVVYYPNTGTSQFSKPVVIGKDLGTPESMAISDFNNDGWSDVVSAWSRTDQIILHTNELGTFNQNLIVDDDLVQPVELKIADIDNDNDLDLVVIGDVTFAIYYNNNTMPISFKKMLIEPGVITENYSLNVVDIDDDGFKDVIIGGIKTLIYKNIEGTIQFDAERTASVDDNSLAFLTHLNDFDQDGDPDLIINSNARNMIWYKNEGTGFFTQTQTFDFNAIQSFSMTSNDFDFDGDIDLLAALPQSGRIVLYTNNGNQNFETQRILYDGVIGLTDKVTHADLNNDGKNDLIWAHPLSFKLNINSNDVIFDNGFESVK